MAKSEHKVAIKDLKKKWNKENFFECMENEGMGLKETTEKLAYLMSQTQDTRASLAAVKFAYSIAGLEGDADKNEINIFIDKLENLNYNQMNQMIIEGQAQARLNEYEKMNLDTLEEKKEKDGGS